MDLWTVLMQSPDLTKGGCVDGFASEWSTSKVQAKAQIARQEEDHADEIIILDGHLVSTISDPDGKEVCVGLYASPCVVTPNIARTCAGRSLVSITSTTEAEIVRIGSDHLT